MKKWKKFENRTKKIIEELNPDDKVYGNIFIQGKFTNTRRQVDVQLIDSNGYDFIIFECKDKSKKIDSPVVEAFITNLKDLGAKSGAIVSNSPYTKGAENIARAFGVDLLHLIDSSDDDIKTRVYAGCLIMDTMPKHFNVGFGMVSTQGASFYDDANRLEFAVGGSKMTARQIFNRLWNTGKLIKSPGAYIYSIPDGGDVSAVSVEGKGVPVNNIHFNYEVIEKYFFGPVELIETSGIYNVKDKTYRTRSLLTEHIEPYEAEKKWNEIKSPDEIKEKVTFGMKMESILPE